MRGITKDFSGGRVLFGVDFDLQAGEVHALVGQNGAGKSTLMKILGGVYGDYGGSIVIDGQEVTLHSPIESIHRGIAIIYQDFTLVPGLTVAENIALGREPRSVRGFIDYGRLRSEAAAEAKSLGIQLPMDVRASRLGVATQQLTEIVKAISRHARILVMDEPTARLSGVERDRLFGIIRDLASGGVSVVYISHFLEEIFRVADRVIVLRDGRVVANPRTESLDLLSLSRLVVGQKYQQIAGGRASTVSDEVILAIDGVGVPGRVEPVSLTINSGEIVGLAGLVGSGRTSLARALVGLEPSGTGRITMGRWSGRPRNPSDAASIGILLLAEDRKREGLALVRSVAENVALSALRDRLTAMGFVRIRRRLSVVRDLVRRLGIQAASLDARVASLSGGNQQKVVFARAIAARAKVLILDQPTAGVDVGAKADLYDQIDGLAREGKSILLISDDLDEILHLCDRVLVLRRGRVSGPIAVAAFDRAGLLKVISENPSRPLDGSAA
jgi:ABC-type sugar transport system ATPase subunit